MGAMRSFQVISFAAVLTAGLAACTAPEGYHVLMGVQRQECQKLPDAAERARCLKETDRSYDRYKAEAEAAKRAQ